MSQRPTPSDDIPFHLKGNFAPVFEERSDFDLEVSGAIPPELKGRFFRNGSNPQSGWSPHWFFGNGMIHGVELAAGRASWYRNRYVRTPEFLEPGISRIDEKGNVDRTRSYANTHVIRHAGKILALEEGAHPWIVDRELETVAPWDFDGRLVSSMTAHPRVCPVTGELLFFGATGIGDTFLRYYRADADGRIVQSEAIPTKGRTMMHDWNVTRNHVVFMDLPMTFDFDALAEGGLPVRWNPDYGARLGVLPREGRGDDVVWCEIDPCYVFHALNGYEEDGKIVLHVCRMERMALMEGGSPPLLTRWTIDPQMASVKQELLDDCPVDFPRVRDQLMGLPYRYGYCAGVEEGKGLGSRLHKFDLAKGASTVNELGASETAGEPVFAACPGANEEDAGWILTFVYDEARDRSDLVILDAQRFDREPVARIHLPARVPFGFHGSWLPDDV